MTISPWTFLLRREHSRTPGHHVLRILVICLSVLLVSSCASTRAKNQAIKELTARAQAGNVDAQWEVGFAYMAGRGVPQSEEIARRWYTAAASQGDVRAARALAELNAHIVVDQRVVNKKIARAKPAPIVGTKSLDFGKYHALVIGNSEYKNFPKLETSVNDANAVAKLLKEDYGFEVTTLIDGTWAELRQALSMYRHKLSENDNLLIYYAGHGWKDEQTQEAYWIPVDASADSEVFWVSNATLATTLRGLDARHIIIVADSCFAGTLVRGISLQHRGHNYLERLNERHSRTALTSGGVEPVTDSGLNGHSVFANAFLEVLSNNEGVIEGVVLFTELRRPVMINADQTPSYGDIRKAGHDNGDFLFVRVNTPNEGIGN